jgi:rhomboid protease GluP
MSSFSDSESPRSAPALMAGRAARAETIYQANRAKLWRAAGGSALFVVVAGGLSGANVAAWAQGKAALTDQAVILGLCGLFFLGTGVVALAGAIRGVPRLTVTPAGVKLDLVFSSAWAHWSSLAGFAITTTLVGRRRRLVASATAVLVGKEASPSILRKKKLSIPDSFRTPLATIVDELNTRHTQALGQSPAVLAEPDPAVAERQFGLAGAATPWLTFALLALLIALFCAEQIFAVTPGAVDMSPSVQTLIALGGLSRTLVVTQGEWYRLFAAPLLHGSFVHIASNGVALLLVGYPLERLAGRIWFLALFVVGGLGGSLMSIAVNPENMVSVGASGAIMGLFAALLVFSFRLPSTTPARWHMQVRAFRVLVPSLLPLATSARGMRIDYGAHAGGALSCTVVALLLLIAWPATTRLPKFRALAALVAITGAILAGASGAMAVANFENYKNAFALIPQSEVPRTQDDIRRRAADLLARYPQDPRAHVYMGVTMLAQQDYAGAEHQLSIGLQQAQRLSSILGPQLVDAIRSTLATVLLDDGKMQEAKDMARSLCQRAPGNAASDALRRKLTDNHLCD